MDEIIIDEKKYVSSKRAAKITGYAKDYVGQLCREGRVPARLVGRSWYVLESAIQDHRFGTDESPVVEAAEPKQPQEENSWVSPKYEATPIEVLPTIPEKEEKLPEETPDRSPEALQASWRAWFDRTEAREPEIESAPTDENAAPQAQNIETNPEVSVSVGDEGSDDVRVPIHTVYDLPPEDLLPRYADREQRQVEEETSLRDQADPNRIIQRVAGAFKVIGVIVGLAFLALSIISTGILDRYLISAGGVTPITGIDVYKAK